MLYIQPRRLLISLALYWVLFGFPVPSKDLILNGKFNTVKAFSYVYKTQDISSLSRLCVSIPPEFSTIFDGLPSDY
jgi:hypothetical protein